MTPEQEKVFKAHQEALRPKPQIASDVHKDWMTDTRPRWNGKAVDLTGKICTKWNERESTWRKSRSCPSRGTSQSKL
jgi:hypothetical protein